MPIDRWMYKEVVVHIHNGILLSHKMEWVSLIAQLVKNLPTMRETWVQFLGWGDLLERGMQPTPVFLLGEFRGQRNLVGYSPWGHKESDTTEWLHFTSLLRTIWRFLKKLNRTTTWPSNPTTGPYGFEKAITQKETCTPVIIAALFTRARTWKQPRCPSTDEWIKRI